MNIGLFVLIMVLKVSHIFYVWWIDRLIVCVFEECFTCTFTWVEKNGVVGLTAQPRGEDWHIYSHMNHKKLTIHAVWQPEGSPVIPVHSCSCLRCVPTDDLFLQGFTTRWNRANTSGAVNFKVNTCILMQNCFFQSVTVNQYLKKSGLKKIIYF